MDRLAMLKQFLEQNPNDAFARYGLAMEYARAGEMDAALQEFGTLLKANPDYTAAYFQAAQALARAERMEEARQWLRDGIACAERTGDQHAKSEMAAMLEELG
jgi:tetratricopeptide (TPR) repeat protein